MPRQVSFADFNCSLARALDIVGERWTLLILRDAFLGAETFSEFHASLGLARNILAERLQGLVAAGILQRTGTQRRPVYSLTEKGASLAPALIALMQWGDAWIAKGKPPIVATDEEGRPVSPLRVLSQKGRAPARIQFVAGPGANGRTRAFLALLARRQARRGEDEE